MRVRTGTSGFSYKAWKGPFYPPDLREREMLAYYAGRLSAVEINNTFYRTPKSSTVEGWAKEVPAAFTFAVKAPQRITHHARLHGAEESLEIFWGAITAFGERLGPILFQLPPSLRKDTARLQRFLEGLPPDCLPAFEFRHESWEDEEVRALLSERGAAEVLADTDERADRELFATAPWGYLRLRRTAYSPEDLERWAARLRASGWQEAFVFFKHEDAGTGPLLAERFAALLAEP